MGCVRKRGKSWNAQVRISGWRTFTKTFPRKSDAVLWSKSLEKKLRSSSLPETNIKNLKLKDLLKRYAAEISPAHKGAESEIYRLNAISRCWLGSIKVVNLTKHHFIQFRDDRLNVVSTGTAKTDLMLIKRVLKVSVTKWGYGIPNNPINDIELPQSSKPRTRRLIDDEFATLMKNASSQKNKYIAPIIEFAVETGMRRSEILGLKWQNIDLETGIISIYDTKNGEDRRIPIMKNTVRVIESISKQTEYLFPITANNVRLAWVRAKKMSNIQNLRFHDLRHEAISRYFEMGLSVAEVALISGHKDIRQLFRYTHLKPENIISKHSVFVGNTKESPISAL